MSNHGRPKLHNKTTILTISVEANLPDNLETIARREGKSRSRLVEEVLADYVKAHLRGNEQFQLESFEDPKFIALPSLGEQLSPERVDEMDENSLFDILKMSVARKDEIVAGLRRKGISNWDIKKRTEG